MEQVVEILKNFEGILTFIAVMIGLIALAVGIIAFLKYASYFDDKSENYKKNNLEFLDRQNYNEFNYLRRLFTDNACEISKLKDEIKDIKNKRSKK